MSQEKAAEIIELNTARPSSTPPPVVVEPTAEPAQPEASQTAGAVLAAARKKAGFTLTAVSAGTKVKECHLAAIEATDVDALPATPFAAGFVKAYASFLGLDSEGLAKQFRADVAPPEPVEPEEIEPAPVAAAAAAAPTFAADGVRMISILGIGAIAIFALWIAFQVMGPRDAREAREATGPRVTLGVAPAGAEAPAPVETAVNAQSTAPDVSTEASDEPTTQPETGEQAEAGVTDAEPEEGTSLPASQTATAEEAAPAPAVERAQPEPQPTNVAENTSRAPEQAADPVLESVLNDTSTTVENNLPPAPQVVIAEAAPTRIAERPNVARAEPQTAAPQAAAPATDSVDNVLVSSDAAGLDDETAAPPPLRHVQPAPVREDMIVNAKIRRTSAPRYPDKCDRGAAQREVVKVMFDISPAGRVTNSRVVESSNNCFNTAAVATVKRWRFDPRTVNGVPRSAPGKTATVRFDQ